jgi:tubulin-specific chaperone D
MNLFIGRFEEYRVHLIDHVSKVCVVHWDKAIRELAAKCLAELCPLDVEHVFVNILPILVHLVIMI